LGKFRTCFRRILLAFGLAVVAVVFLYLVIDWRDGHAWNAYYRSVDKPGASLDFHSYIPKEIPDANNFGATAVVQSWFKNDTNVVFDHDAYSKAGKLIHSPTQEPSCRQMLDLVMWRDALAAVRAGEKGPQGGFRSGKLNAESRAQAAGYILKTWTDDDAAIKELRAASARSQTRYPIVYATSNPFAIAVPHLARLGQACDRLQLRACAGLAAGQSDDALGDIQLIFYLADTLKSEPMVVSYLFQLSRLRMAVQAVWEGLIGHRWTDAQLQQLQASLEQRDLPSEAQGPLHAERAAVTFAVEAVKGQGTNFLTDPFDDCDDYEGLTADMVRWLTPSGWFDMEKLHYCQHSDVLVMAAFDGTQKRVFPHQAAALQAWLDSPEERSSWRVVFRHDILARALLPGLGRIPFKTTRCQVEVDQCAVACALERYRRANGKYPASLQALTPRFMTQLPNDVLTGEPYKYHLTDDGQFVLYSVGWNEKDDGGVPGQTIFDQEKGDWVWDTVAR